MASSRQLKRLATNPADFIRFQTTGKLPRGVRPDSPLIRLLKAIGPHDRMNLRGLTLKPSLGYLGQLQPFYNAEQALKWLAPSDEVFGAFPAESFRDKRFNKDLYLDDLLACCASAPEGLAQRYPRLVRPSPLDRAPTPTAGS